MDDIIRVAGIDKMSVVNGPGLRYTIFTQGCTHNCKGCHNPQTHDFDGGFDLSVSHLINDIRKIPSISGITLTGGDPLCINNYHSVCNLCKIIKSDNELKRLNIWLYTGYKWEEVYDRDIMNYVDVVVDGEFIIGLKSFDLKFIGSSNQRIIDVKKSINNGKENYVEWTE